jgi:hypothetical protein
MLTKSNSKIDQYVKIYEILAALSKPDNFRMFLAAKAGLKYSPLFVEKMGLSRKKYYNSLYESWADT